MATGFWGRLRRRLFRWVSAAYLFLSSLLSVLPKGMAGITDLNAIKHGKETPLREGRHEFTLILRLLDGIELVESPPFVIECPKQWEPNALFTLLFATS